MMTIRLHTISSTRGARPGPSEPDWGKTRTSDGWSVQEREHKGDPMAARTSGGYSIRISCPQPFGLT